MSKEPHIELLDLRHLSRDTDKIVTEVGIYPKPARRQPWMLLGAIDLNPRSSAVIPHWTLSSRVKGGHTDCDHSTPYILSMSLVGVEFHWMSSGTARYSGFVAPRVDRFYDFNVPSPDYNPLEGAEECTVCEEEPHLIVPDDNYLPPPNGDLFRKVYGMPVDIMIATVG